MAIAEKLQKSIYAVMALAIVLGAFFAYSVPKAAAAPAYDYQLITQSAYPATLAPGATTNVWIEVKNAGTQTWYNDGGQVVRLGSGSAYGSASQQRDYSSEFANTDWLSANRPTAMLHPEIRPGWHTRFQFNIKAPSTAGTYKAYFTPVVDGLTWMKDIGIYWQLTVSGDAPDNGGGDVVTPGDETTNAGITVSVPSDTPAASTVLTSATGVDVLKFTVKSSTTINEIQIKRTGVGNADDFSNVYLYDGATRLTSGRSLSSDTHIATFVNLGINASAGKTLTIKVDVAASGTADANNQSAFEVASVNGTSFTSKIGNTMTIGSLSISAATIDQNSASWTETVGASSVEAAKFSLNASSATNDLTFNAVTITNAGTLANSKITNLVLKEGSTVLGSVASMSDDKAVIVLDSPYTITKGLTKYFVVTADLTGGRVDETIIFYLDETTDLNLKDSVYGFGINLTNSWASGDQTVTLTGGRVTIADNGPVVTTYAANTSLNPFVNFTLSAERNITVKKVKVDVHIQTSSADIAGTAASDTQFGYVKNIRIVDTDTGTTLVGPLSAASSGTCADSTSNEAGTCADTDLIYYYKEFTDQFDISAGGARHLSVKADLDNSITTTNTVYMTVDLSGTNYIYDNDTAQYVAAANVVPSSLVGNSMNLGSDSLTASIASTPASATTVKKTTGVAGIGFLLASGDTNSSHITKLAFTGEGNTDTDGAGTYAAATADDLVSAAYLYMDGVKIAGPVSVNTSGVATFNNLDINLNASQSKKVVLYYDITSTAGTGDDDAVAFGIANVSDITVENGNGNTFNATLSSTANDDGASVLTTILSAGTIVSALDSGTPISTNVVAGTSDVSVLKIKYTTAYEAFTINKLKFWVDASQNGGFTADTGSDDSIASVTVTDGTNSQTKYVSGSAVAFTNLGFVAAKDATTVITAKVSFSTVPSGADSGDVVELIYDANGTNAFEAVGAGSGTTVTDSTTDITTGGVFTVRRTLPTVSVDSSYPCSSSTCTVAAGNTEVMRFSVAADAAYDLTVEYVSFKITATDNNSTSWTTNDDATGNLDTTAAYNIYKSTDLTTALTGTWSLHAVDGSTLGGTEVVRYARFMWTAADTVSAGGSTTYVVKMDLSGASSVQATKDNVIVDLIGAEDTTLAGTARFQWEDGSATNIAATNIKNFGAFATKVLTF